MRIFRSNPEVVKDITGGWAVKDARSGCIDVQFGVRKEIFSEVVRQIDADMQLLESSGKLPERYY